MEDEPFGRAAGVSRQRADEPDQPAAGVGHQPSEAETQERFETSSSAAKNNLKALSGPQWDLVAVL